MTGHSSMFRHKTSGEREVKRRMSQRPSDSGYSTSMANTSAAPAHDGCQSILQRRTGRHPRCRQHYAGVPYGEGTIALIAHHCPCTSDGRDAAPVPCGTTGHRLPDCSLYDRNRSSYSAAPTRMLVHIRVFERDTGALSHELIFRTRREVPTLRRQTRAPENHLTVGQLRSRCRNTSEWSQNGAEL
jgi:hypothetical protein